mgnify:CR=1 FL=1
MEMKGLNHVNIGVLDLEKSKKFYCEVFGMAEVYREPHLIFLICGRDILTLQDNYNQKPQRVCTLVLMSTAKMK